MDSQDFIYFMKKQENGFVVIKHYKFKYIKLFKIIYYESKIFLVNQIY